MKINEIFKSIQGESSYIGLPCTFVRVTGCNLRCNYCDTTYAHYEGTEMAISSIVERVSRLRSKLVCVTGGEPLADKESPFLIDELIHKDYTVLVETNGSHDIRIVSPKAIKIMDVKCPDSDMSHEMHWKNMDYLTKSDEVKFVLNSRNDYDWMKGIIKKYHLSDVSNVLAGTVFGKISPHAVVRWILEDNLKVRFQLQIHKYIWDPLTRGV